VKFPLGWVRDFVEIAGPPQALAEKLSGAGLVVDAIEPSGDDFVLDVDVPSNRPDCMNVYGLAREVAALTGSPLRDYPAGAGEDASVPKASSVASVSIEDAALCSRYAARIVMGVTVGATPEWMASRLKAAGLNVVNNIVDITNYVLWEYGHPLHAFDLDTLHGPEIVVRRARKGETVQTLDGMARTLTAEMLVIADADRPVAIAGVMGGAETMIASGTRDLLLESAHFDPVSVRRTSKALALSTDASYRFERGANAEAAGAAIDRAAALIAEIAGGRVAKGRIDVRPGGQPPERTVGLRLGRVETLLGAEVGPERAERSLAALGFGLKGTAEGFEVVIPPHRQDVTMEVDVVEEVARMVGYANIPERLPQIPGIGEVRRFAHRREDALRRSLSASGYDEVITLVYVSGEIDETLREPGTESARLSNPFAEGQEVLRSSLLPGLAQAARHNLNHGSRSFRIYELGHVFRKPSGGGNGASGHADEPLMLGLAASGLARPKHWAEPARTVDFYDIKGALEEAAAACRLRIDFAALNGTGPFAPGSGGRILHGGRSIGRIGTLDAAAAATLGIKSDLVLAEVNLGMLFAEPLPARSLRAINRFPSASRDLALVVRDGTTWAEIDETIREAGGETVTDVSVFDRYTGSSLPAGHASLAVSVVFQHARRTLAAEEVADAEGRILARLKERFGITLRK